MTHKPEFEVAIVGFGPVGAIAACWLGQAGVKTLVIEKSKTVWEIPRALALDHEILRVFQNIGVIEQILPYTAPFGASEHFGASGQLIRRIDVVAPPHPLGYLPNMVFTQPPVEAVLRERAQAHASVSMELGSELMALSQDEGSVALHVLDEAGNIEVRTASYVIACDGASSTVRRLLGISFDDLGFDEPWLVVDLMVHDAALIKLPSVCAQYCDPARPYTYIIGPGNHRRWEIMLSPGEDPHLMEREESVWRLLARWVEPADGRLWRASSYRFHALVAQTWRKGNVFLAGDAAHQQPPFIGQGMCQGVRDVTNLCWKLIAVLRDESSDMLLDTYGEERKLHVTTLTERIKEIGAAICERDPEAARMRDEALLARGGGRAPVVTRQEIVPPLRAGLICPESRSAAGTIFPQPRLANPDGPRLMDEVSGLGWRVFVDGRKNINQVALEGSGIRPFILVGEGHTEMDGVIAAWFDLYRCQAAIVRPDHYVYCTVAELGSLEKILCGLQKRSGLRSFGSARETAPELTHAPIPNQ
jgi:3-(3-hydroxy-phenyl)propionate hydroxylase